MEDFEEIIDQGGNANKEVPQAVKTLGILSIIGSSLFGLIFLIAMFWVIGASSAMGRLFPIADPAGLMVAIIVVFLLFIAFNVLGILGVVKMMKGKKGGFILYAIVTGLWALLLLVGSINNPSNPTMGVLMGVSSIGFIIAFGAQMKNMPEK